MDKHANQTLRDATGAYNRSILEAILPAIREVARFKGYAVAIHGSLKRDIDLIAVAWVRGRKAALPVAAPTSVGVAA